ncbi:hypothetical protein [Arthrobacter sp. StoSoilB13]|jgi:hypothetical protein|nr:hypothetical protein [Arthrobacter sp. StoSoilB13]BCW47928.1 hypothetical protein StoSoilB13_02700 [Arthrobacter sp. StoSoilB13]
MKQEDRAQLIEIIRSYGIISLTAEMIAECLDDEGFGKIRDAA